MTVEHVTGGRPAWGNLGGYSAPMLVASSASSGRSSSAGGAPSLLEPRLVSHVYQCGVGGSHSRDSKGEKETPFLISLFLRLLHLSKLGVKMTPTLV